MPVLFYIIWQRNFGSQKWMTSKWMTMKLKSPHTQAPFIMVAFKEIG